jgi:xanthine dehydrogenase small subunit
VEAHGSQCGFCTPGIVMSLFAQSKNAQRYDPAATAEALAGNLCRCTGYDKIVRAVLDAAAEMRQAETVR